jgi:hypothetical protein
VKLPACAIWSRSTMLREFLASEDRKWAKAAQAAGVTPE